MGKKNSSFYGFTSEVEAEWGRRGRKARVSQNLCFWVCFWHHFRVSVLLSPTCHPKWNHALAPVRYKIQLLQINKARFKTLDYFSQTLSHSADLLHQDVSWVFSRHISNLTQSLTCSLGFLLYLFMLTWVCGTNTLFQKIPSACVPYLEQDSLELSKTSEMFLLTQPIVQ